MELPQWQWLTPAKPMGSLQDLSIPGLPKPPRPKPSRPANKPPVNRVITGVNSRTTIAIIHYNGATSLTPNAREARPGLSIVKMYMADYVLRYRKPSSRDRVLLERMIRLSDDGAASEINRKYPGAINAIAREYGLTSTKGSRIGVTPPRAPTMQRNSSTACARIILVRVSCAGCNKLRQWRQMERARTGAHPTCLGCKAPNGAGLTMAGRTWPVHPSVTITPLPHSLGAWWSTNRRCRCR